LPKSFIAKRRSGNPGASEGSPKSKGVSGVPRDPRCSSRRPLYFQPVKPLALRDASNAPRMILGNPTRRQLSSS
jgi:hypothetical protein